MKVLAKKEKKGLSDSGTSQATLAFFVRVTLTEMWFCIPCSGRNGLHNLAFVWGKMTESPNVVVEIIT